nr:MAG TPA: YsxB-like protein [Caudoviricetes sp.]
MIKAQLKLDENRNLMSYQISGHAHYLPKGMDIVCAAVSVLAITVTNDLQGTPQIMDDNGLTVADISPTLANQALTKALKHGLQNIATQYPEYLQLTEV